MPSDGAEVSGADVAEEEAPALGEAFVVVLAEGEGDAADGASSALLLPPQPVSTSPAVSSPATRRDGEAETLVLMGSP